MNGKILKGSLCALAGMGLLCTLVSAAEVTVTTADGLNGADSYVRFGTPTQNYGNTADLVVKDAPPGQVPNSTTRKIYKRFDLSRVGQATIYSATLELQVRTNNGGGSDPAPKDFVVRVFGLDDGDAGEAWVEGNGGTDNNPPGEITWNNAPANDTSSATGTLSNATLLGAFEVTTSDTPGTLVTFSNPALANFLNTDTDGLVTLILTRVTVSGSYNLVFESAESGVHTPTLTLNADGTYLAVDTDAFVRSGTYSSENYGLNQHLLLKDAGTGNYTRKSYLGFDVSGFDLAGLGDAELILDVSQNNMGGGDTTTPQNHTVDLWGVNDSAGLDNWPEGNGGTDNSPVGEITWNNAPANVAAGNGLTSDATLLGTYQVTTSHATGTTFAIGAGDAAFVNFLQSDTDGRVSLILRRVGGNSGHNLAFASKEHVSLKSPILRLRTDHPPGMFFTVK